MKQGPILGLALAVLFVIGLAGAMPSFVPASVTKASVPVTVAIPSHAVELAPGVFSLGTAVINGQLVEGLAFIDYAKDFRAAAAKPAGKGGGATTCYAFLARDAKWKETEAYAVAPDVDASLTGTSLTAWDEQATFGIFGAQDLSAAVDGADTSSPDGKNEVLFGNVDSPGAIAVTIVWGIFSGPPSGRKLVEWDAVFDNVDFAFGDATLDPSVMDFQNIATHEFGHAAGMGHPDNSCADETMYAYADFGETKKRDLNAGDIAGIQALYK